MEKSAKTIATMKNALITGTCISLSFVGVV